jgi:hypothetical protein
MLVYFPIASQITVGLQAITINLRLLGNVKPKSSNSIYISKAPIVLPYSNSSVPDELSQILTMN